MLYEHTVQRDNYINARGKIVLMACPGSGKTTSIAYKLGQLVEECNKKNGLHRGIACLSFTNKACEELEQKYLAMHGKKIAYPNVISTIDSFITENIVMQFWYRYPLIEKRPSIVNEGDLINRLFLKLDGVSQEIPICGFNSHMCKKLHTLKPEEINIGQSNSYYYQNHKIEDPDNILYARQVIGYRLKKGVLNSQDAAHVAEYILSHNPEIASSISQRYPYIIIDEAQDTSELQTAIFDHLIDCGLENIEYVGDIYQSIYEWRNASPDNFNRIKQRDGWESLELTENRRSTQSIIDTYSRLRTNDDENITSWDVEDKNIPIRVYKCDGTNVTDVMQDFKTICENNNLKNCHILTRGRKMIRNINGVVRAVYHWKSRMPYMLVKALVSKEENDYTLAIKYMIYACSELSADEENRREHIKTSLDDRAKRSQMIDILQSLPSLDATFEQWTNDAQQVLKEKLNLQGDVNFMPKQRGANGDTLNHEILAKYYRTNAAQPLPFSIETIHSSKGASYGAVLLFLAKNSTLSLNDFKNDQPLTEKQRLLYVACSRAEQFLAFAVPADTSNSKIRRLLGVTDEQIKSPGLQLELF